jgi:hypothetical protein
MGILILAGVLGIIFQTLIKIGSLKKDYKAANQVFTLKDFFNYDYPYILASVIVVFIMAILLPEIIKYRPGLENYLRALFTAGGAIGTQVLSYFFGKSKKYIRGIIDAKTNIADGKDD